jgi:hypothetical protein
MYSNLIFWLAIASYVMLLIFNLNRFEGTGEQAVGIYYIGFIVIASYTILSLVLTIRVSAMGGFNWISDSIHWRHIGTGMLWLGMIAGVVISSMAKAEISFGDKLVGIERLVALLFYHGGIWLPLLMLLPYASFLNPEWRFALAPPLANFLLLLGCAIGLITFVTQSKIRPWLGSKTADYEINKTLRKISHENSVTNALFYIGDDDPRLHDAALNKIKQQENYEDEFLTIFENNLIQSIGSVFLFWKENKVEHPERFIQAINNSLPKIISEFQEVIVNPYKPAFPIDVETMCSVLDHQFKESSEVFRSNMLLLQDVLAKNPAKREIGDSDKFNSALEKYQISLSNWLQAH